MRIVQQSSITSSTLQIRCTQIEGRGWPWWWCLTRLRKFLVTWPLLINKSSTHTGKGCVQGEEVVQCWWMDAHPAGLLCVNCCDCLLCRLSWTMSIPIASTTVHHETITIVVIGLGHIASGSYILIMPTWRSEIVTNLINFCLTYSGNLESMLVRLYKGARESIPEV